MKRMLAVEKDGGTISEGGAAARRNGRTEGEALSGQDHWVAARRLRMAVSLPIIIWIAAACATDAWNRPTAQSARQYMAVLNADDTIHPDVREWIATLCQVIETGFPVRVGMTSEEVVQILERGNGYYGGGSDPTQFGGQRLPSPPGSLSYLAG